MQHETDFVPSMRRQADTASINWLLRAGLVLSLAMSLISLMLVLRPFGAEPAARPLLSAPGALAAASFDISNELASLLNNEAAVTIDLADAAAGVTAAFAVAGGPPLDLLAQVRARRDERTVRAAPMPPPADLAGGPVLLPDERMIVDANAERREIRLALSRLQDRAASGETAVAPALAAQPLLRRAEFAAACLDDYGDALLLAEGEAMKQMAYFGFQASRAVALLDLQRAEAILG